jgi:hypothetical protein
VDAEADFRPRAPADGAAEQVDDIPEPARLVLASHARRHADAALPGGPRQGHGPADARFQEEGADYYCPTDKDRLKDKLVQRLRKLGHAVEVTAAEPAA